MIRKYLELIEFIYCYCFYFYQKQADRHPGVMALLVVSTIQILNVITLIIVALLIKMLASTDLNKYYFPYITLTFFFLDYRYIYKAKGRDFLLAKYTQKDLSIMKWKVPALIYVVVTITLFLTLLLYYIYGQ